MSHVPLSLNCSTGSEFQVNLYSFHPIFHPPGQSSWTFEHERLLLCLEHNTRDIKTWSDGEIIMAFVGVCLKGNKKVSELKKLSGCFEMGKSSVV